MADYILTYSKTKFYPLEPISEEIKIIDIEPFIAMIHDLSQRDFNNVEKEYFIQRT